MSQEDGLMVLVMTDLDMGGRVLVRGILRQLEVYKVAATVCLK